MPILKRPDPDFEPEPEFTTFKDGSYTIKAIQWMTKDDEDAPIFVNRKDGQLTARYRTIQENGEDGPPGSLGPAEVPLLVRAFGGKPGKLPKREGDPTAFLIAARDMVNSLEKPIKVKVESGWIQYIPGMSLPPDKYFTFLFHGVATKNELDEPSWRKGQYGRWFGVNLEVAGNVQQKPTIYDGLIRFCIVSYGLHENTDGQPEFDVNEGGKWTGAAVGTNKFITAYAPTLYEEQFGDPNNICPELDKIGRDLGRKCVGMTKRDKAGRVKIDVGSLSSIDEDPDPFFEAEEPDAKEEVKEDGATKEAKDLPSRNVEDETPIIDRIKDYWSQCAKGEAFDKSGKLTAKGKTWAGKTLKPFLQKNKIKARIETWNDDQMQNIENFMKADLGLDDDGSDF